MAGDAGGTGVRVRDRADGAGTTARVRKVLVGNVRASDTQTPNLRVRDDGLSKAFEFAAGPVVMGGIGWLVDQAVGTRFLFLVIFAVFGVIGTCVSFFYQYEEDTARLDEGKPWTRRTF